MADEGDGGNRAEGENMRGLMTSMVNDVAAHGGNIYSDSRATLAQ